jgi:type IV pilus assembly protein PilW
MVSIVIGMIVMVALVSVYGNISRTNTEMSRTSAVIESGRFSIDLLQEDLQHAGYWGGYVPDWDNIAVTATPTALAATAPDPCLSFTNWTPSYKDLLVGLPVQAFSSASAGVPTGLSGCSSIITDRKANTDVLVVRRAESCVPGAGNCEADSAGKIYFQPSFCTAQSYALTTAAAMTAGTVADAVPYVLGTTGFTLRTRACGAAVTPKRKFVSHIYYVRTWSSTSNDGIPTLVRATFNLGGASSTPGFETAQPLIEGVDGFVVDLGIDSSSRCSGTSVNYTQAPTGTYKWNPATCAHDTTTPLNNTLPSNRGDGVPESYLRCGSGGCTVAQLRDVVAAKIYVLARSREASASAESKTFTLGSVSGSQTTVTPGTSDKFRRQVFQTTVRLNNVSGRRESP